MLLFLCEFDGDATKRCPRNVLSRVLQKTDDLGFDAYAATRDGEGREFRKHITDWELEQYFEII